jgi:Zn-dependent protease/CBS domain-containing protein
MQANIHLGRVAGIPIGLHYSWLIIAFLIILSLAQHFDRVNPAWTAPVIWTSAIITGLLFFAGIVAHELSHAVVARARGVPVRSITLFALGGVAAMERDAHDATTEFWVGIAGPLMSVFIGFLCLGLAMAAGWTLAAIPQTPPTAVLVWLGYINFALAAFNMIPGYPLDGGRVLRAIVWGITKSQERATRIAAGAGQVVALGFILWGLVQFFSGEGFGGLWIAFIGWFLLDAARASVLQVEAARSLRGIRVADLMSRDCPVVTSGLDLQTLVDEHLLRTGKRCFVVQDAGMLTGLITPAEISKVERAQWPRTPVGEAMRPLRELRTVRPDTPAMEALELMSREDINQLPVVADGRLLGIFSRAHALQVLQTRQELGA